MVSYRPSGSSPPPLHRNAADKPPGQQYFPLTPFQHQLPDTNQPILFFSHTTPATSSSSNPANKVEDGHLQFKTFKFTIHMDKMRLKTKVSLLILGLNLQKDRLMMW